MMPETEFCSGYLRGISYKSKSIDELLNHEYDLMVLMSSWDKRCVSVTAARNLKADTGLLVLFDVRDSQGFRDKHDPQLIEFCEKQTQYFKKVNGHSIKVNEIWQQLMDHVIDLHRRKGRTLNIFIDCSTSPRFYVLALLATCLESGIAKSISIFYGEGHYPDKATGISGVPEEINFTDGHWKAIAIPGLVGQYSPGKKRFYFVSIGFEGWKTMRVVSRADPDRVSILFPDPGFKPEYVERTQSDNEALIKEYRISNNQIIRAPAGDAIAAWKALSDAALERINNENIYYLCSGTKPHSIALGLRALCLKYPAVLYNLPEGHKVVDIEPSGDFWRFDLTSLTATL